MIINCQSNYLLCLFMKVARTVIKSVRLQFTKSRLKVKRLRKRIKTIICLSMFPHIFSPSQIFYQAGRNSLTDVYAWVLPPCIRLHSPSFHIFCSKGRWASLLSVQGNSFFSGIFRAAWSGKRETLSFSNEINKRTSWTPIKD